MNTLEHNRSLLRHLIYAMEHDRSLHAENTSIAMLKGELREIEGKLNLNSLSGIVPTLKTKIKL